MKTLTVIVALGTIATALADEKSLFEDFLAKQPLPKSYSVHTGEGEVEYNYTADLAGLAFMVSNCESG